MTFDGLALTFPGACEYLLVREASGQFTVSAQNLPCGASGLTCTKALTVRLQGTVVHMLRGGCDIEGGRGQGGGPPPGWCPSSAGAAEAWGFPRLPTASHQSAGVGVGAGDSSLGWEP